MKSFKNFMAEQQDLDEAVVRKGAVAAYALQGRRTVIMLFEVITRQSRRSEQLLMQRAQT